MNWLAKTFKNLLYGVDNTGVCYARCSGWFVVLSYLGLNVAHMVMNKAMDPAGIGAGLAAVWASVGAVIFAKDTARTKALEKAVTPGNVGGTEG